MTKARDLSLAAKAPLASPVFTGNVGIGVVPEAWFSSVDALQVASSGALFGRNNEDNRVGIASNAYETASNTWKRIGNSGSAYANLYETDNGAHKFKVAAVGAADSAISWTTAVTIDNAGIVTKPNQPSFKVHQSNTTLSSAGLSTVSFSDSETYAFDNGNNFSSNIFTAPVAGKYFFAASLRVDGLNDYFRIVITQNDRNDYSSDIHAIYNPNSSVNFHSFAASGILNLAANDTVRVNISSTNDSSWISQGEGTFSGYLLG